jgi:hypothetical protein
MDNTTALNFHNCYTIKKDKNRSFWAAGVDQPDLGCTP